MADIRVTCPMCKTQLEIDSQYEGQEVECGTCLQVFTATTAKKDKGKEKRDDDDDRSSKSGGKIKGSARGRSSRDRDDDDDDDRPRRKRRRDDDDDEYDHDPEYYDRPRRSGGTNGLAIASLILGITAFFPGCCCYLWIPLSLGAIVTGSIGMKNPEGKGLAVAGIVLGVCALALYGILVMIGVGFQLANPNQFR